MRSPGTRTFVLAFAAAVAFLGAACASGGGSSMSGPVVTAAELEETPYTTAYEVLRNHRSVNFRGDELHLRGRGPTTLGTPLPALLVVDGARLAAGAVSALRTIQKRQILRIEILRPAEAATRYGLPGGYGAVVLELKRD